MLGGCIICMPPLRLVTVKRPRRPAGRLRLSCEAVQGNTGTWINAPRLWQVAI